MSLDKIIEIAASVRKNVPLVHNITNYVTVNDVANAELAIGGSALMADDIAEVHDMVSIASCTNINMGTLNARTIESMIEAGKAAANTHTPMVFDPVGAGASGLRNDTARRILTETSPAVIRGNLSEISFIAGLGGSTKGVDSSEADALNNPVEVARKVALEQKCVVAITGAIDVVTDGEVVFRISNGTPLMSKITGTGCMCDGLIGCFIGALAIDTCADGGSQSEANPLFSRDIAAATAGAICSMGLAGELAAESLLEHASQVGTGSLHIGIIDQLSCLNEEIYRKYAQIEVQ